MKPAVVLSTHTTGLGIIRSLGQHGVPIVAVYYGKSDMGYVSKYVEDKVLAPHPEKSENQFVNLLIDIAKRYSNSILIPADDATLVAVSKNKTILANHYIVACTDWAIAQRFIDKKYTYDIAESVGIPTPKTIVPQNISDAKKYSKSADYPCLVKPCQSHRYAELFGRKLLKVRNAGELMSAYKQAFEAGMDVLLQEYIVGDDSDGVNYNSYYWNSESLVEFTAQKVRLSPPDSGVPSVVISKHIPEVLLQGRKMLQALGFNGYSCIEFKKDTRDGTYKLLEVNGRHNRSLLLSVKCGINFPLIEYNHLVRGAIPSPTTYRTGVYWIDFTKDLCAIIQYRRKAKLSLIQFIKPYIKSHAFAVLCIKDIMPFIKRCICILGMALEIIFKSKKQQRQSQTIQLEENG